MNDDEQLFRLINWTPRQHIVSGDVEVWDPDNHIKQTFIGDVEVWTGYDPEFDQWVTWITRHNELIGDDEPIGDAGFHQTFETAMRMHEQAVQKYRKP